MISGCQNISESSEASSVSAVSSLVSSEESGVSAVSSSVLSEESGVSDISSLESSEASSVPAVSSENTGIPSDSPYTLEEYKAILQPYLNDDEFINYVRAYNVYPSPDGENQFIEVAVCLWYVDDDYENYVSYLFLNDFDHFVKDYGYTFIETVKWIDNNRALIDQGTIIDIETGQEKNIMDNSYFDNIEWSYIVESDVNSTGTKIAVFSRRHNFDYVIRPSMQYLFLYDIAEDKWIMLYEASYRYEDTGDPSALLKWKTDDCIEFYLHYGAKLNFIISSNEIIEVPNFIVEDGGVYDAARLREDGGFAGEKTIYVWKEYAADESTHAFSRLYLYMERNNLKIAPGEYFIYENDPYENLIAKLNFVPNE